MIYVITYADEKYKATQRYNECTAYKYGADKVYAFGPNDIDKDFQEKNKDILAEPKGNGYWLWKPYFIDRVIQESKEGDWIVYTDSALYFNRNIKKYIGRLARENVKFAVRETKFLERQFTKTDVIHALKCEEDIYLNSGQFAATVIVLKNCEENKALVAKWLEYSQNKSLISDEVVLKNCDDFVANRHDQSILSLLCKKKNISIDNNLFRDIVLPFHRRALLTYHHSVYDHKYQMYLSGLIRLFKCIF